MLVLGAMGAGVRFPTTFGIFGGYAVPPTFVQYVQHSNVRSLLAKGDRRRPTSLEAVYRPGNPETGERHFHDVNMTVRPFAEGDTYYIAVGGGGGFGDPLERDPSAVVRDLRAGQVTPWAAERVYRVVVDASTLRLDESATRELRERARRERLERGRSYAEFVREWSRLRPPAGILRYYGSYPDPAEAVQAPQPLTVNR